MSTQKVIVSGYEVSQVAEAVVGSEASPGPGGIPSGGPPPVPRLTAAIPWWARVGLSLVALCFPLLCLVTVILRIAFRAEAPRIRHAWTNFLATLLMASGMLMLVVGALAYFLAPLPVITGSGLAELDERVSFPVLPAAGVLTSVDASRLLKPLVVVVSPVANRMGSQVEVPSNSFGAGELLHAEKTGYLFVTARHVAQQPPGRFGAKASHVLVATQDGTWGTAEIVGTADALDLALLWLPRHAGSLTFTQPLTTISDGAAVFVIGHPEGLRYTLSTGIVSGFREQAIQISAAVSPGNSGGPVYDDRGNLAGIVSAKFDRNQDANAENLSFAVNPAALLTPEVWHFATSGREHLDHYIAALKTAPTEKIEK